LEFPSVHLFFLMELINYERVQLIPQQFTLILHENVFIYKQSLLYACRKTIYKVQKGWHVLKNTRTYSLMRHGKWQGMRTKSQKGSDFIEPSNVEWIHNSHQKQLSLARSKSPWVCTIRLSQSQIFEKTVGKKTRVISCH